MKQDALWLVVGFSGQALFSMRFIVQWLKSEREKKSVVPLAFWAGASRHSPWQRWLRRLRPGATAYVRWP